MTHANHNPATATTAPPGRSLADLVAADEPLAAAPLRPDAWIKILVLAGLFAAINLWQFQYLVAKWLDDNNWAHGFLIPLFSIYLLYARRDELLQAPRSHSAWGLPLILVGLAGTLLGFYPVDHPYLSQLSMLLTLLGLVLYVAGWKVLRVAAVPILFLIFAMPFPRSIYESIAMPLQGLAAKSSGVLLGLFGVDVQVTSLHLQITSVSDQIHHLTVAEACSGVRSLMAFVALSVAMAYIEDRPNWQRIVFVLAGIPIAIVCNILRVTLTGAMFVIDKPELGEKFMHEFMGMALLVPAFLLLLLLGRILHGFYLHEDDEDDEDGAADPPASAPTGGAA